MTRLRALFLVSLAVLMATTAQSRAATTKEPRLQRTFFFPGSVCMPYDTANGVGYFPFGISNPNGTAMFVGCPLQISVTRLPHSSSTAFGTAGTLIDEAIFSPVATVYDRNPTEDVSCTFRKFAVSGSLVYISPTKKTTSFDLTTRYVLAFPTPVSPMQQFAGWWDLQCSLPPVAPEGVSQVISVTLKVEQP